MESFFLRVAVCFCFVHKIAFSLFAKLCANIEGILYMANVTLAIAQWIRLRLPSCHPRFDSQACHLRFFHLVKFGLYLFMRCAKRTKINKKEAGFGPFFLKKLLCSVIKRKAGNALILNTAYRDLRKFIQYKKYFPKCKSLGLSGYSGRI